MKALTLCALLLPLAALADSPFDGTWVAKDESQVMDPKPYVLSLASGVFENKTAVPPNQGEGRRDGPAGDGPRDLRHGRGEERWRRLVRRDRQEGRQDHGHEQLRGVGGRKDADPEVDRPERNRDSERREPLHARRAGPAGAHAAWGSWRITKSQNTSANARTITYKSTPDGMSYSTPTGQSYTAKFDGKEVPVAGDPGGTTVSLKKVNANTFVKTNQVKGKVVEVDHWTVGPDGKTMKVEWERKDSGRKGSAVFDKQ